MLISKIRLSNFKNFEDVEVDLSDMNVIVGANASGKSNFIEALQFVKDIKDFGIENAISLHGGIEYLQNIQLKKKTTVIEIVFKPNKSIPIDTISIHDTIIQKHISITYSIEIIRSHGIYRIAKESFVYENQLIRVKSANKIQKANNNSYYLYGDEEIKLLDFSINLMNQNGELIVDSSIIDDINITLPNGNIHTIKKDRLNLGVYSADILKYIFNRDKKNNPLDSKTLIQEHLFISPINLLNFAIYDFDLKKAKESTPITGKAELERNGENLAIVIRNILSNKEKSRQFANIVSDILPFIKELDVEKFYDKSLLFKVRESFNANMDIPSSLLSDGTISITAILIALFFEDKDLAIFEEPEHGIHPALIAKLMQLFYQASEKKQVIITTHNPEILKHTRLDDLILVSRNDDGFATIGKPAEKEMVKAFLENELGIDQLFIQNLLDA